MVCGYSAVFCVFVLRLHFDSLHTSSTAGDPIVGLTRETVLQNIWDTTWKWIWIIPAAFALLYFVNDVVWENRGKLFAFGMAFSGALMILGAVIMAGLECFRSYP